MKRTLITLLIAQLTLSLTSLGADFTYTHEGNTLEYTTNNDGTTATVTAYLGDKPTGALIIPSTVTYGSNTYTVTAIAGSSSASDGAFFTVRD